MQLNGVLNLDKPPKITSRQAVDRVKRILRVRKAGHGGTLDPDATGVLLIFIGKGTKLFDLLQVGTKEYEGKLTLGVKTDTLDASGEILETAPVENITEAQIAAIVPEFVGEIEQTVPMYSAVKRGGKPLHKLARRGIQLDELPKRTITIESLDILSIELPEVEFRVVCTKGTYVRSLAADIGDRLGCGGHLSQLRRTRSGCFKVDEAYPLEALEENLALAYEAVIPVETVKKAIEDLS